MAATAQFRRPGPHRVVRRPLGHGFDQLTGEIAARGKGRRKISFRFAAAFTSNDLRSVGRAQGHFSRGSPYGVDPFH
jgi:hypothetical protein